MESVHGPVLVVANPRAGDRRGAALAQVLRALDDAGVHATVRLSEHAGHGETLARDGVLDGARLVLAVGGDGTVNDVVNGLVDAGSGEVVADDVVLGVVGAGSGCDFVRTFGLDIPVPRLVSNHLLTPTTMPLDLGRVRHRAPDGSDGVRLFANIGEVGFGADVVATAARLPRRLGARRYLAATGLRGLTLRPTETTVTVDHTSRTEPLTAVVVANGQFFGGGLKVAPRGIPDDGRFNVQTWQGGPGELFAILPLARHGEHLDRPDVREWQSRTVEVDSVTPLRVEVDGDVVGTTPARFDLLEHALRLSI